ncbi:hypothetical protein AB7C87_21970 [Natrarchaeobius sp. A-rgal3]|uniref:hypothetical protein n=1 Tax=Natrarchaeobius versutus TaxID=1679078 RepID=UPI00350F14C2
MKPSVRGAVVPFVGVLFPAVWYLNRDVASVHHPPFDPSPLVIALGFGAALVGAAAFAALASVVVSVRFHDRNAADSWLGRVFLPDRRTLAVFAVLTVGLIGWALAEMAGIGPGWLATALDPVFYLAVVPLLLLAPLAIHSYPVVVVGLALSAVWLSALSALIAAGLEYCRSNSNPGAGNGHGA